MNLVNRVKNIITEPKFEWIKIDLEFDTMQTVILKYVVPLAAVGALCTFIGYSFIGNSVFAASINLGLRIALVGFISQILSVIITAYVIDALAPSFNSDKNINRSTQLVAYGFTPAFIGSFLNILPSIAFIGSLFGLYGIYLMYLGLGPIKKTPEDKKAIYMVVTFIALLIVYFVIGALLGRFLLSSAYQLPTA